MCSIAIGLLFTEASHCLSLLATIPDEVTAMSMAAPAVATASRSAQPMGHTAPLLPTPPSVLGAPPTLVSQSGYGIVVALPQGIVLYIDVHSTV